MGRTITTDELFGSKEPQKGKVVSTAELMGSGPKLVGFEQDGYKYNVDYDNGEPIVSQEIPSQGGTYYHTKEEVAELEKRGPITWTESAMNREWQDNIPFLSGAKDLVESGGLYKALERHKAGEYTDPMQKTADKERIDTYMRQAEEMNIRGMHWKSKIYTGVADLFPMMVEFGLTGGLYTAGRVAGTKVATKALGKYAKKKIGKMALATAPRAVGVGLQTTFMPNRYVPKTFENMVLNNVALTDKGMMLMRDAEDKPASSFIRAFADTYIEVGTERAGKVFKKAGGAVFEKLSPKATRAFSALMAKLPLDKTGKLLKKGGVDGMIEEMGEEELGRLLRASFKIDDEEGNLFERIIQSFPSLEDRLVEAAVFAVPAGASMTSRTITSRLKRRGTTDQGVASVINSLSATEQEAWVENDTVKRSEAFDAINIAEEMTEENEAVINEQYSEMVEAGQIDPMVEVVDAIDQYGAIILSEKTASNLATTEESLTATEEALEEMVLSEDVESLTSIASDVINNPEGAKVASDTAKLLQRISNIKKPKSTVGKLVDRMTNPIKIFMRRVVRAEALKAYGKTGEAIYNKVLASDKWSYKKSAEAIDKFSGTIKGMSDKEAGNFFKYVRGEMPTPEGLQDAVNEWRRIAKDIAIVANQHGIKVKDSEGNKKDIKPSDEYYPDFISNEFWEEMLEENGSYLKLLQAFAKENDLTITKADSILQRISNNKHSIYGHLEKAKEADLPETITVDGRTINVYERDPRTILDKYIRDAYARLGDAREFGGQEEKLSKLYQQAIEDGDNFEEIQRLTSRMIGEKQHDSAFEKISSWARAYNNITKLSLSAVTNIADISKAFIAFNGWSGFRGTIDAFTKSGKSLARKSGVTKSEIERYAKEAGISIGTVSSWMYEKSGFEKSEEFIRTVAVNSAKRYVQTLHKKLRKNPNNKFASRRLEQLGLNPAELAKRDLQESDYIQAATEAIFATQPVSRADIPFYWNSPSGKVLSQYKRFAHKQARFLKVKVFDELKAGNFKPLFWTLIMSQALGEPLREFKALLRGKDSDGIIDALNDGGDFADVLEGMLNNLATIGGIGLVSDAISAITSYRKAEGILKFILGPTMSDLADFGVAFYDDIETMATDREFQDVGKKSKKGKVQPKVIKKLTYAIPFFGPALSAQLFPTSYSLGHKKSKKSKAIL